jgi:CheY-like chemotaxis protein/anti-sigma regulatory factor (Ser/Thr protein kinase)
VFSRAHHGQDVPVDVRVPLQSAIAMATHEIRNRARLVSHLTDVPLVMADEGRLAQVFLNLLLNAAHAIPEGHYARNVVTVRTRADDGFVCVEIEDTGTGIAPDVLPRLFEPFFTTKPLGVGSGLGLSVSQTIVTGFGGAITAQSVPGKGSMFTVKLPVDVSEPAVEPDVEPVTAAVSSGGASPRSVRMGRFLVIEAESSVAQAISHALIPRGEVTATADVMDVRRRLGQGESFDVILCDMALPGQAGQTLFRWIEQNRPDLIARVVRVGGSTPAPDEQTTRWLGKPFAREQLEAQVMGVLARPG